jgi:Ni,Fe-hydrogenase III large subunit/Ni,Fe-hydrogenase III component G
VLKLDKLHSGRNYEMYFVDSKELLKYVEEKKESNGRLILQFASDERSDCNEFGIYYVFSLNQRIEIIKTSTIGCIDSISHIYLSASLYEREIREMFGIEFKNSGDSRRLLLHGNWPKGLYPQRKDMPYDTRPELGSELYEMHRVEGDGIFEIPVGPVHAGIIEPGHFRFSVSGERILNLEARLGYVHKGIEKKAEELNILHGVFMAERVAAEETIHNAIAYAECVEDIAEIEIPKKAKLIRVIFAELERMYNHLGDIGGLCTDVAYALMQAEVAIVRNAIIVFNEKLCGSRYLRNVIKVGGVREDIYDMKDKFDEFIKKLTQDFSILKKVIYEREAFLDRLEETGRVNDDVARAFNLSGPALRSTGVKRDVRTEHPYECYGELRLSEVFSENGDVYGRMDVKLQEIEQSAEIIQKLIPQIEKGPIYVPVEEIPEGVLGISMVEGPKGENVAVVISGANGSISRYKVRTASYCNWPAVCFAVRDNIVPDFPLINKSFNLSYSGNDL